MVSGPPPPQRGEVAGADKASAQRVRASGQSVAPAAGSIPAPEEVSDVFLSPSPPPRKAMGGNVLGWGLKQRESGKKQESKL